MTSLTAFKRLALPALEGTLFIGQQKNCYLKVFLANYYEKVTYLKNFSIRSLTTVATNCNTAPMRAQLFNYPLSVFKMLRSKLKASSQGSTSPELKTRTGVSGHFTQPFWSKFYDTEIELNDKLREIKLPKNVAFIYNPVEYAGDLHCAYLRKYLKGPKSVVFVGMNPGANGMGQTGVPFGNIKTVKEWMALEGSVQQPPKLHPNRPVTGLSCAIEEPSGTKFWGLLNKVSSGLDNYAVHCFMHNFCPLLFFDSAGKNITPSELKGDDKKIIRDICLEYFEKNLELLKPSIVVAVGNYVHDCFKSLPSKYENLKLLKLVHPSPRSPNNNNWPEKAEKFFEDNDLVKYIRNEV